MSGSVTFQIYINIYIVLIEFHYIVPLELAINGWTEGVMQRRRTFPIMNNNNNTNNNKADGASFLLCCWCGATTSLFSSSSVALSLSLSVIAPFRQKLCYKHVLATSTHGQATTFSSMRITRCVILCVQIRSRLFVLSLSLPLGSAEGIVE